MIKLQIQSHIHTEFPILVPNIPASYFYMYPMLPFFIPREKCSFYCLLILFDHQVYHSMCSEIIV